jgi:hypothetical protein
MTSVTADEYAWIRSSPLFRHALEVGYTLALVRGVVPAEVLRVMGAEPHGSCSGAGALVEEQDELFDAADDGDEPFLAGAFGVPGEGGDWTLVLLLGDGGTGIRPHVLEALSAGGRAVAHTSNGGKPMHFFHWYEDGELRTTFEWPTARSGSTPDALNSVMSEVGFDLPQGDGAPAGGDGRDVDTKAATFALAERLTGVGVTEDLLGDAEYLLGRVPEEPAEEWTGIVIDITDAQGGRFRREFTREGGG